MLTHFFSQSVLDSVHLLPHKNLDGACICAPCFRRYIPVLPRKSSTRLVGLTPACKPRDVPALLDAERRRLVRVWGLGRGARASGGMSHAGEILNGNNRSTGRKAAGRERITGACDQRRSGPHYRHRKPDALSQSHH